MACASVLFASLPVQAAQGIPYRINFQGRLTDASGNILADGSYNIKFRIWTLSSGGTNDCTGAQVNCLWETNRVYGASDHRITVTNGLFSVQLGDTSQGDPALSPSIFNTTSLRYLEIELPTPATNTCASNGCASFTEGAFTPRHTVGASPYAFVADTLDGLDSADFGQITAANTFTGTNTFSKSGGAGIVLSGTPASAGSILQIGSTLSSGNSSGTLIGANGAFTGDLLNLQVSNATKLKVDNSGNLTLASGAVITIGASAGSSTTCSGGQFLQNQTTVGGVTTGGTCATPAGTGASTTLNNLGTTSINADLLPSANNTRAIGSASLVWSNVYAALVDAGSTTTTLGVGTANASAITIGKSGTTTTFNGPLTLAAGQSLTLTSGTGTFAQTYSNSTGTANTLTVTDSAASGTTTVNAHTLTLAGTSTSGTNNIYGLNFTGVTNPGGTNNFYGLNFGTGFTDLLRYNNTQLISGTGILQSAAVSGTYSNLTGTGALASGSIASGFGTISTANSISTSSTISTTGSGTITSAGAFTGPTATNTINGLVINSGALSAVTGFTQTSGTASITSAATTGNVLAVTGASLAPAAAGTGTLINGTFTAGSTNTSGNSVTNGILISPTVATSGATGTKAINGIAVGAPTITSCTGGNCTIDGLKVSTLTAGAASTITSQGVDIQATGISAGTLTGMNISGITAGAGTEVALAVGSGWDNVLTVGGTPILNGSGVVQSAAVSGSYANVTGVGTLTAGTWQATAIAAAYGGTGQTSYTIGDLLYASGTTTISKLGAGTLNNCLVSGGPGVAPSWGSCSGAASATPALDNLASVAINTSLISDTNNADDLGSSGINWRTGYFGTSVITPLIGPAASTALTIQTTTAGDINLKPAGTSNVVIGTSDTTGTLLVLDTKTGSGDPTGVNGGMYYNSNNNKFRCYQNSIWVDCNNGFNTITKTADQAATQSSTTLQNDSSLTFPVNANTTYTFDAWIPVNDSNATADMKWSFTTPASSTLNIFTTYYSTTAAVLSCNIIASAQACSSTVNSTVNFIKVSGFVAVAGTSGSVTFQFAQNTSAAASFPVIKKGATLTWHQSN